MAEKLCLPDSVHWCTECCLRGGGGCALLGDIGGGRRGCMGHDGKIVDGLTQLPVCKELDCLDGFSKDDREIIRQAISRMPAGEFRMSKVLSQFKIGRRICAWCVPQRVIGWKLNLDGDTHTICEDCQKAERWK